MTTSIADLRTILIDTSAWIALANADDENHSAAMEFHRGLSRSVLRVVTWGVISETYTWLRYHLGYRIAERWLAGSERFVAEGRLEIDYPADSMTPGIHRALRRFEDQDLSYVDALSIAVIQSRGDIDAVFAFDHHLGLAGIPVLP